MKSGDNTYTRTRRQLAWSCSSRRSGHLANMKASNTVYEVHCGDFDVRPPFHLCSFLPARVPLFHVTYVCVQRSFSRIKPHLMHIFSKKRRLQVAHVLLVLHKFRQIYPSNLAFIQPFTHPFCSLRVSLSTMRSNHCAKSYCSKLCVECMLPRVCWLILVFVTSQIPDLWNTVCLYSMRRLDFRASPT